ncbi:hypothetical protein [Aurantimonas endophytica]|uniref:Putative transcriptional regulator of viral defense system n=1 Tax=Aurantimonas endophytica TaxID=1522175 RepID=A0A7W6HCH7_9HYPH|nr:hypothetical protein [Aurantimonas endophytica]MBB4002633.1 putative transcriptional regulator of viral defense system [Aurantimonas endophytica]MCO6403514.1 hypothetical protein [Aurantimonas endophytica]
MRELVDLPDATVRRIIDYVTASAYLTNGRHDFRIPHLVADAWAKEGYCVLRTNDVARRLGTTRRTACKAIARLLDAGVIRRVGTTPEGWGMYVPCLERGEEWRADYQERMNVQ